jgi:two-component system cell cycle sensor histidine kinase/response regulator CckA
VRAGARLWLGAVGATLVIAAAFAGLAQAGVPLWVHVAMIGAVAAPAAVVALAMWRNRKTAALDVPRSGPARSSLLGSIGDAFEEPVAVVGAAGDILETNEAFRTLAGTSLPVLFAGDAKQTIAYTRLVADARAGRSGSFEFVFALEPSGALVRRMSASPVPGHGGHVLIRVWDNAAPAVVPGARELLSGIAAAAGLGYYEVDREGRILYANDAFAGWIGIAKIELARAAIPLTRILKDRSAAVVAPYDPFGGSSGEGNGVVKFRRTDGSEVALLIAQRAAPPGSTCVAHAIARPFPEPASEAADVEAQIAQLFRNAPIGLAIIDAGGIVRSANPAFRDLVGLPADRDAVRLHDLLSEDSFERVQERTRSPEAQENGAIEIAPRQRPDRALDATVAAIERAPPGAEPLFVMYCLDATDQRQFQTQMAQAQKMQAVGQLAGGIAHDFNNLLTAMIGYCDLLLQRHRAGEQSFADIMQIKQNANRAAGLVRQLLAFSRQQTLKPRVLKITDVLTDLTHLLRRLVGANIMLTVQHSRELGFVRVDQGYFEQVIINLVVNARDAMPDGGEIRIETKVSNLVQGLERGAETIPPGEYVRIDVIDRGTGISPEHLGRIFDPFFTTKALGQGTGLGLSTVYGIVKQTGGYVFVDSVVGRGSTFTILLPRHQPAAAAEREPVSAVEAPRDLTGAGTILLVEDEDPVRAFSARALRNKGYKAMEARTGLEALEMFQREGHAIDLIVTDVMMPQMDGPTLIRRVREKRPRIRIVCISGYAEESFRDKIGAWEDIRFLPKPYSLVQLAGVVKDAFAATAAAA